MALSWRSKILLFALESVYGQDEGPTGSAHAILATEVRLTPMEGSDVSRDLDTPYMGAQPTVPTEIHAKLDFRIELAPSGAAGTPPAWGPILRACAVAETISAGVSVTYNPVSNGHESASIYIFVANTRYILVGSRGTCVLRINAQGIPYLEFSFTGLFTQPSEQARPTPTLTAFQKPQVGTTANTPTFTIDAWSPVLRTFSLDLGNQIENRFLIGSESVLITDKAEAIEMTVEAVPLTTFNPYLAADAQTGVALQMSHGTAAGRIATIDVPAAQMQRPQGLENAQNVTEWPLRFVPQFVAGNDQWTLTLT